MPSRETLASTLRVVANVINPNDPQDEVCGTASYEGMDTDDDDEDDGKSDCSTSTCDSDWYRDDEPGSTAHNLALRLLRTCCSGTLDVAQSVLPRSILDAADSIASRSEDLPDGLLLSAATMASVGVAVTLHSLLKGSVGSSLAGGPSATGS
ncbi:hypothetical protein EHS25_002177 [Saitozyma podzolica]|uniref:Uncharacterized protein n=1 Tax=Saitozyma podzolica TaxID=1890683 RepID=A0A427YEX0_9TREE|nr:hypothetical protein EHS25_002177 [Saitozyma podzolica]